MLTAVTSRKEAGAEAEPSGTAEDDPPQEGALRRWGIRVLQLVLTVVVTWFIVDRVGVTLADVSRLDERWLRPAWGRLGASSAMLLAGFLVSAGLWGRMVRELGGPALGFVESASIYFTANLGRYVPGKVWQLAGLAYLAERAGVRAPLAVAAAVLVQATSLAGATVVGAAALLGEPRPLSGWGPWAAGGIVVALAITTLPPVFRGILGLWFRLTGNPGPREFRPGMGFGIRWVGIFAGNWIVYGAAFWLMAGSFGVEASFLHLGPAFAAAYVLGYAMVFAPAGLGVREGFLIAFLQPVTGGGPAAATAVLARFWMTAVELLPAAAFAGGRLLSGRATGKENP